MNSKDRPIRWGIIGAGIIAAKMAEAINYDATSQLLAVASKTPSKASAFAETHGIPRPCSYAEIVSDPDIDLIYIATTHNFHFENALMVLNHGKHVVIEKPFTVNALQARQLVAVAREKRLFMMEAIWTRFLPSVKAIQEKIRSGEIGEVKSIHVSFGGFVPPKYSVRLNDPALAGGVTLDMGIYPISFVCFLMGALPSDIKSMTRFSDLGVDEVSQYLFRFPSGCFAQISTSFNLLMKNEATIYGSLGYIDFPKFPVGDSFSLVFHNRTKELEAPVEHVGGNHENGFIYQVAEAVRCIQEGRLESPVIPLDETVAIMQLMDDMRKEWDFKYPFE